MRLAMSRQFLASLLLVLAAVGMGVLMDGLVQGGPYRSVPDREAAGLYGGALNAYNMGCAIRKSLANVEWCCAGDCGTIYVRRNDGGNEQATKPPCSDKNTHVYPQDLSDCSG